MVDVVPLAWLGIAAGGAALGYLLERLLIPPVGAPWQRPAACHLVHWGLYLCAFALVCAVLQRPLFAAAVLFAFLFLVVMVNNAKFHSLREPFICQDFEYFTDAIKHPRLYIPFLGLGRALAAMLAFGGAVWAGFTLESSLAEAIGWAAFLTLLGALLLVGGALLALGSRYLPPVAHRPIEDLARLGLLASLWRYWLDERKPLQMPTSPFQASLPPVDGAGQADLVVVQSESFFDARRCFSGLRPDLLAAFDGLKAGALLDGTLAVPAWGANTVRTEFAFLSGLTAELLGVHRFNPYRRLAKAGVPTLASTLRARGYRTVCVHPYPAGFYDRDRVYPKLGFDEFIDIGGFADAERCGPYIGDLAVAAMVGRLLDEHRAASAQPIFVFVITMENHGPLHLEKVQAGEAERLHVVAPSAGCDDLTIYARHLKNADRMFGQLREALSASPKDAMLCIYGDHVPIMPAVYAELGTPDGATDYVVWHNRRVGRALAARPMAVEDLAVFLADQVGGGPA